MNKLLKEPVLLIKLWCIPPVALHILSYIFGSYWPIFCFLLGVIATILVEAYLVLWYLNTPLEEGEDKADLYEELKIRQETDNVHFEDPRDLAPDDA